MCGAVFLDNTVLAVGSGEEDLPDGLLATGGADNVVRLFRRQD
ncbi:hypothetical protein [Lentzea aerocolonigenes]|nr:hypothetical protein [Lentzea aerocolonigenes]